MIIKTTEIILMEYNYRKDNPDTEWVSLDSLDELANKIQSEINFLEKKKQTMLPKHSVLIILNKVVRELHSQEKPSVEIVGNLSQDIQDTEGTSNLKQLNTTPCPVSSLCEKCGLKRDKYRCPKYYCQSCCDKICIKALFG